MSPKNDLQLKTAIICIHVTGWTLLDAFKLEWAAEMAIKPQNSIVLCASMTNKWANARTDCAHMKMKSSYKYLWQHYSFCVIIMQKGALILELCSSFRALIINTKCSLSALSQRLLMVRGTCLKHSGHSWALGHISLWYELPQRKEKVHFLNLVDSHKDTGSSCLSLQLMQQIFDKLQ